VVHVGKGAVCERPIHLLFLTVSPPTEPAIPSPAFYSNPRVLVVAEEDSESSIVETYAGSGERFYFTNGVTEIALGKRAKMDHNKLQQEGMGHITWRCSR